MKKKSTYKWTPAHAAANDRYLATKARITITMEPEQRAELERRAAEAKLSLNRFILSQLFKV